MKKVLLRVVAPIMLALSVLFGLSACGTQSQTPQQQQAQVIVQQRDVYVPVNDIEGKNYNAREKIADDPTTILWCTAFPTNPNSAPITVPIVGKLTSSNKRPYPTSQSRYQDTVYYPELPGPDGMYGSSSEYRYGFRPDGTYVDFTGLETYCSTEPSIFQREKTVIDLQSDPQLTDANKQAQEALKQGNPELAQQILENAVKGK